jgi:CPA2 family monovalent cation:H+ antiporter-2
MPHDSALIVTIAAGFGIAFLFGAMAARLKLPPLVGYLVAGVVVGPFTPGYVADSGLASQLAEFGVILLMFGVGLHFSLDDLGKVRRIVLPGAVAQSLITGTLGFAVGRLFGWTSGASVVLGLSLSVASTVVLLKGLEARDRLDSPDGRIAVGWLVVEDLLMVLALVLLPAVAPALRGGGAPISLTALAASVGVAIGKVALFVALMFFVGRRFVPWLLEQVTRLGSRELFTLAVLASALGVGTIASSLFGVSVALGAFFAGAVISESDLSHRAAADALPMQDAFAVLFFVSVGMLFDPAVLADRWIEVLVLVAIIVAWKSSAAFLILRLLGRPRAGALVVGASLGQIGEFSFIVAGLGVTLGIASRDVQAVVVAAAIVAITLNSPLLTGVAWLVRAPDTAPVPEPEDEFDFSELRDHVILVGHGRVGTTIADALLRAGAKHVVVEEQERVVAGLRRRGEPAILGDASRPDVLERAGIAHARLIVITAPEPFRARRVAEVSRAANAHITVAVRTHSAVEQKYFEDHLSRPDAPGRAVYAEREAALSLAHYSLLALGRTDDQADAIIAVLRGEATAPTETFQSVAAANERVS